MKLSTRNWIVALSALCLTGCDTAKPTKILFLAGGKPILFATAGQVVKWVGPDGTTGVSVTFGVNSPCQETGSTNTCTVQSGDGYYPYDCKGCSDPGMVVGSDSGLHGLGTTAMGVQPVANSQVGAIYCDKTTKAAKVYTDPLVASAATSASNSTVQWLPAGGSGITTYSVTLQSGTCNETTINQTQNVCTLLASAPASQTYTVTADTCTASGSATLTVH